MVKTCRPSQLPAGRTPADPLPWVDPWAGRPGTFARCPGCHIGGCDGAELVKGETLPPVTHHTSHLALLVPLTKMRTAEGHLALKPGLRLSKHTHTHTHTHSPTGKHGKAACPSWPLPRCRPGSALPASLHLRGLPAPSEPGRRPFPGSLPRQHTGSPDLEPRPACFSACPLHRCSTSTSTVTFTGKTSQLPSGSMILCLVYT